ncbi:MAG: thioesterase family protein [Candidatus Aureabacteria bacterium]|nr:thioesterase family protein [Candidatus Auribacterota bacterium]
MTRARVRIPEQFPFTWELDVRIDDVNYAGHIGNETVLRFAHEARLRFLKQFQLNEMDVGGTGLMMVDAVIVFKSETFYGDRLKIEVATDAFSRFGFDFVYKITNVNTGKEVARLKTGMVCFDYLERKIAPLSDSFRSLL